MFTEVFTQILYKVLISAPYRTDLWENIGFVSLVMSLSDATQCVSYWKVRTIRKKSICLKYRRQILIFLYTWLFVQANSVIILKINPPFVYRAVLTSSVKF